jgi:hypothetical protein
MAGITFRKTNFSLSYLLSLPSSMSPSVDENLFQ